MALFGHEFKGLNDLFVNQLQDLYDAENRLTEALPKMADAASSSQLKSAFQDHLQQTQTHVARLEHVFNRLGCDAKRETCDGMKGLIKEGEGMIGATSDNDTRDAGLIAAAQKVEHYEIAGYGTVRAFAEQLGLSDVAQLLQQTLDEESEADRKLTQIAESRVNPQSQMH
jgi:ferritin-like metal-binding protein YciE